MTEIENRLRYYLGKLEEPYRTKALSQIDLYYYYLKGKKSEAINNRYSAVLYFRHWESAKEGYDYWSKFNDTLPTSPEPYEPETEVKPKKVKLIEFDYEKHKAGAKAVYRNGEVPEIIVKPKNKKNEMPIVSINEFGNSITHTVDGYYFIEKNIGKYDLLLEVEEEVEPELFVNVYKGEHFGIIHNTIEEALNKKSEYSATTYKLVKVNQ